MLNESGGTLYANTGDGDKAESVRRVKLHLATCVGDTVPIDEAIAYVDKADRREVERHWHFARLYKSYRAAGATDMEAHHRALEESWALPQVA